MSAKKSLKKFQNGVLGIVTELVTSLIFGFLMTLFARDRTIGPDVVLIFTAIGFVGSIALMVSFRKRGFIFLLGWILTAWLLRNLFSPFYLVVYIVAPVIALFLKSWWALKKSARRV